MKYFICSFGAISLGLPSEQTERIISIDRIQTNVYETGENETFISIPALLRQKDTASPHGLVLKSLNSIILLTPKIDVELDIPQEKITKLPEVFTGVFSFFSGACFLDGDSERCDLLLLLDPKKITELTTKLPSEHLS